MLEKISDHVYWMPPGKPDRPSLCAVAGAEQTLMLDGGASPAHAEQFLSALREAGIRTPRLLVLTHWHWDHVFGAASLSVPVIAQAGTAARLAVLAGYDWSDAALDQRVASGEELESCARDIKEELPGARTVRIARPEIVFDRRMDVSLGEVRCRIRHVGGDHAADSSVIYVEPDGVLFLGDCLYDAIYARVRHYTRERLFPLLDSVLGFDAHLFVEGHTDRVMSREDLEALAGKMRLAARLVEALETDDETAVLAAAEAQAGQPPDEDTAYFIRALMAGRKLDPQPRSASSQDQ